MDVIGFELDLIVLQRFEFVAYFRSYTALGLLVLRWTILFCRVWGTNLPLFTKVVFACFDRGSYIYIYMFIMSAPARRSLAPFHCKSLVKGTRFREKVALTSEFRMSAALLNPPTQWDATGGRRGGMEVRRS